MVPIDKGLKKIFTVLIAHSKSTRFVLFFDNLFINSFCSLYKKKHKSNQS